MTTALIFYDPAFPVGEGQAINAGLLDNIGRVIGADGLREALRMGETGCFVNLHAPYFPKAAWPDLLAYLKRGGGLISIGGAPFKRPVRRENGSWLAETEQTAYHRQLHIHETLSVNAASVVRLSAMADIPLFDGFEGLFDISDTWNLVPYVTKSSDLPHQMGSAGPMDAQLHAVLKGVSAEGRSVAAPAVLWENTKGAFAGGRWLFLNQPLGTRFWEHGGAAALAGWARYCAKGVTELWIKPNYASYEQGERAMLTLQMQALGRREGELTGTGSTVWTFDLSVSLQGDADKLWTHRITAQVSNQLDIVRLPLPVDIRKGLYEVLCRAESADGEVRLLRQGFWGFDAELLAEGSPVRCGRDYFEKDGRPLPVVGMTYMTSDVARKFLFLPNAAVWDRDMDQMKRAGINWIRTGIWTAYRNVMQVDGHASEEALRAIDAFLLMAKKHGLQVTFTFFSFTPEPWEGLNPYLDPRSVEAQKRFVRSIVSRHRKSVHVDWDLINEPSFTDPQRIFSVGPRSCGDPFERAAFASWLETRHGHIEWLQERWNMTPEELPSFAEVIPPEAEDINFDVQDMRSGKRGTRWLDYALFSMEMHNRWALQLVEAIKRECPDHLVTIGQDEALRDQRPSPFFYAAAADYTTVHSWWLNDDLAWDGIFAKTPDKPSLVQETGIMYVETPEGRAKRTEEELRNLLERKYAYAFATGGAGAIQWIWNTNYYMDNANESHIGALRADGTEKPEADVSYGFGRFMEQIRDLFREREPEEIAVVFPYTNDFSNRRLAFDATTKLTRVLAYGLKVPFRAVSAYHLDSLNRKLPKVIILPSAHNMEDGTLDTLTAFAERTGATLLATGPLGIDAYWRPKERLTDLLGPRKLANVLREEALNVGGEVVPVSFGNRRIAEAFKEVPADGKNGVSTVVDIPLGRGRLIWSPLPVELNERIEPLERLYKYALDAAGCGRELEWISGGTLPGVYGRKLNFKDGALFVFVSEYAADADIEVKDPKTGKRYSFLLEQERSVLFAVNAEGGLLSVYRPQDTLIRIEN